MDDTAYTTLQVIDDGPIARITLDNPPVNVLGLAMMAELHDVLGRLAGATAVRVIVFDSANPDLFIPHVDMTIGEDMDGLAELAAQAPDGVNVFQALGERLRHQPQVTIVKLAGIARGGGAEFVTAADMTFAATETARLGQVESLMGIVPGGGGTQYLSERVGRNRALEIVLTGGLLDAETAERYGWINRAVPEARLDAFVDDVARNVAHLADGVIASAKAAIAPADLSAGLVRENDVWAGLIARPAAAELMTRAMGSGAQTPEGERRLELLLRQR